MCDDNDDTQEELDQVRYTLSILVKTLRELESSKAKIEGLEKDYDTVQSRMKEAFWMKIEHLEDYIEILKETLARNGIMVPRRMPPSTYPTYWDVRWDRERYCEPEEGS